MKLAYLIVTHAWPQQLRRQVCALRAEGVSFFVHVDAKSDAQPFAEALADIPEARFVAPRVSVNWGSYSQLEAILNTARTALSARRPARRLILLSGACYPVAPNSALLRLSGTRAQFIGHRRIDNDAKTLARIRRPFLLDHPLLNHRAPGAEDPLRRSLRNYLKEFLEGLPDQPALPFTYHKGSTWWALTSDAVQYILDWIEANPETLRSFRYSQFPEEALPHSVLADSPYADAIRAPLHYIDWSPESIRRLKYLDETALEKIGPRWMFVRKVHPEISARLLDELDRRRTAPVEAHPALDDEAA